MGSISQTQRVMQGEATLLTLLAIFFMLRAGLSFSVRGGGQVTVRQGQSFLLSCLADSYYEFCTFRSSHY